MKEFVFFFIFVFFNSNFAYFKVIFIIISKTLQDNLLTFDTRYARLRGYEKVRKAGPRATGENFVRTKNVRQLFGLEQYIVGLQLTHQSPVHLLVIVIESFLMLIVFVFENSFFLCLCSCLHFVITHVLCKRIMYLWNFAKLVCLVGFLTSSSTTRLYRGRAPRQERLTILRAATHETELGDHDFCLSRSHYTDTDPTCRERAATAGIEPGTSSPGVARSTAELPRPPCKAVSKSMTDPVKDENSFPVTSFKSQTIR